MKNKKHSTYTLIDLVKELKFLLSKKGPYSITRTDGRMMEIWEAILIGDLFEKMDKIIDEEDILDTNGVI